MSNCNDTLTIAREHGEQMHQIGISFGRKDAHDEIFDMLMNNDYLDAAQAVLDMDKEMTSEQYEADAKADHRTDI